MARFSRISQIREWSLLNEVAIGKQRGMAPFPIIILQNNHNGSYS